MAMKRYDREDVIPIVLCILSMSMVAFINHIFRAALEGEYADLKGLISVDENYDESNAALLSELDDELTVKMAPCVEEFQSCIDSFANIYAIDLDEIFTDERLVYMAQDMFDDICYLGEGTPADRKESLIDINTYFYTVMGMLQWLCKFVETGELDVEEVQENFYEFLDFDDEKNIFQLAETAENSDVQRLAQLAVRLNHYLSILLDIE